MRIITIVNQKGGTGKTTTTATLAHALALKGCTVWGMDTDPQGQLAVALGVEPGRGLYDLLIEGKLASEVLRESGRPRLSIVPGDKWTLRAQTILQAEGATYQTLARTLLPKRGQPAPDYVIIDTAPSIGLLQAAAIWAADLVVVPCACDFLSTDGVNKVMESIAHLAGEGWTGALLGILPTFYDDTTRESRATLGDLIKTLGAGCVFPPIHRATVLRECAAQGKTIWELEPGGRAAQEYAALVWRVLGDGKN